MVKIHTKCQTRYRVNTTMASFYIFAFTKDFRFKQVRYSKSPVCENPAGTAIQKQDHGERKME